MKQKLIFYKLLFILSLAITNSAWAQIPPPTVYTQLSAGNQVLNNESTNSDETWYKWTNDNANVLINLKSLIQGSQFQVTTMELYDFDGTNLYLINHDTLVTDSTIYLWNFKIDKTKTLYVRVVSPNTGCGSCPSPIGSTYDLQVLNIEANCPVTTTVACDFVKNGNFESHANTSCNIYNIVSNFYYGCDWFSPIPYPSTATVGTPDYFLSCAPTSPYYKSVHTNNNFTTNGICAVTTNTTDAYAGIHVIQGVPGNNDTQEYLCSSLASPLQANKRYQISLQVRLACFSKYATKDLEMYFTTSQPTQTATPIPQHIDPTSGSVISFTNGAVTDKNGWTTLTACFTPTTSYSWITIGCFKAPNNITFTDLDPSSSFSYSYDPVNGQIAYGSHAMRSYYYIDNVSIKEVNLIATGTSTICAGGSSQLNASLECSLANGYTPTYSWTPSTGLNATNIFNPIASPVTTTIYTVTANIPNANGSSCAVTKTVQVTVVPNTTVTAIAQPSMICSPTTLTITPNGATTYTLYPGGQTTSTAFTLPSPSVTTTYTVVGAASGCGTQSVTVTVNINNLPPTFAITAPGGLNIIANGTGTNVVNFSSTITNTTGLSFTWNTWGPYTPTANISITQPTVVSLTVSNSGCGTSVTQSVCVNYVSDLCSTTSNSVLTNYTLSGPLSIINQTITISGTLTIPANLGLTLSQTVVKMEANSKIVIQPNGILVLEFAKLFSCDGMWYGIEVQSNSVNTSSVSIRTSSIEDANVAIFTNHLNTNKNCSITLTSSSLNKNYIDISLNNAAATTTLYPLSVKNCSFTSNSTTTSPGNNLKCSSFYGSGISPIKDRSFKGLDANAVRNIEFINLGSPTSINLIQNKDYGLYFNNTNATVYNVTISEMKGIQGSSFASSPSLPVGVGIYSENSSSLTVKPAGTTTVTNAFFSNVGYGIVTSKTNEVEVKYCDFSNPNQAYAVNPSGTGINGKGLYGIYAVDAKTSLKANLNTFSKTYYPVTINYSVTPTTTGLIMSVAQNTFNANGGSITSGVTVQSAVSFNTAAGNMRIAANTFSTVEIGVKTISVNSGLRISNNTMLLKAGGGTLRTGVYLAGNNNNVIVDNNNINGGYTGSSAAAYTTIFSGILCENSPGCKIQCNTITQTGHGIEFKGNSSSTGAGLFKNTFNYPIRRGVVLSNGGLIGTQGSSTGASANVWNSFVNITGVDQTFVGGPLPTSNVSNAANSPLWIRNNANELPTDNNFISPSAQANAYSTTFGNLLTTSASDYATCPVLLTQGLKVGASASDTTIDRDADFVKYINQLLPAANTNMTAQAKYMLKQYMYKELKEKPSSNIALLNFYNQQKSSSTGVYNAMDSIIANGNNLQAQNQNAQAPVNNIIEQHHQEYNAIYLNGVTIATDYAALNTLANLCPYEHGNAVYQARALLNMASFGNLEFDDNCSKSALRETQDDENGMSINGAVQAKLYPNPNNGSFTFAYDLKDNHEANLQITDVTGKLIYSRAIDNLNNFLQINTTELSSGIYFIQLINNKSLLWNDKLMISK